MKVRIIGAGAVGAVVADRLSGAADTAFIAEEERKERYSQGLMLNGRKLSISVLTPSEADTADLIIFAVKNFSLDDAMETAAPFVGGGLSSCRFSTVSRQREGFLIDSERNM